MLFRSKIYFILTWDNDIKNRCELTVDSEEPTFTDFRFNELKDKYAVLSVKDSHEKFKDFVEYGEWYCVYFDDVAKMKFTNGMNINLVGLDMSDYVL